MTPEKLNQPLPPGVHVPVYLYLTVPLAVLAVPLEMTMPGSRGQIGFVLMLVPALMAAFDGGFRPSLFTGLVGAAGLVVAAWVAQWSRGGPMDFAAAIMPAVWGVALIGCGAWLGRCLDIVRHRADQLQDRCAGYERSIYQLYKDSSEEAAGAQEERRRRQQEEAQRLDMSRLLLNIQHLGRQLSGNLEMNAVFHLVTEAARKLLKAPNPRLFLLDQESNELVEHTPDSSGKRYPADRGMLGWVVRHAQIITAEDVLRNPTLADLPGQDPAKWQSCAPLVVGRRVLGVLAIDATGQQAQEFDRLLYIVANFSAVALNNGKLFQRVEAMARADGLTGLLNHATFQSRLAEIFGEAQQSGQLFSVILSDIDHFKEFNDRYGHQAGDFVLQSVAKLWKRLIPPNAVAARYGGEEFVCVLPGTDRDEAAQLAESLRFALEQEDLEYEGIPLHVTASFGLAAFPVDGDSPAGLIRAADQALYTAKRAGRNRVCVAPFRTSDESEPQLSAPAATQRTD